MSSVVVGLLAFLTAAVGAWVSWLVAKRKTSGSIDTSEAAQLWAEGKALREDLRREIDALQAKVDRQVEEFRREMADCKAETDNLRRLVVQLQRAIVRDGEPTRE